MRLSRVYLPAPFQIGETLSLNKEQAHYVLTVLRLKHDRLIELFDGQGTQAHARLIVTSRRTADVIIESIATPQTESPLNTILLQGISKGDRMDFTIQKCVELGINTIQPLWTENCDVRQDDEKIDKKRQHWQEIAIHACEQSNRNTIPAVLEPMTLTDWLSANKLINGLILDPYAPDSLKTLSQPSQDKPIHLLVGPEGGLTDAEVTLANAKGLTAITLGPRILRTETAGMSILSALQALWGDF